MLGCQTSSSSSGSIVKAGRLTARPLACLHPSCVPISTPPFFFHFSLAADSQTHNPTPPSAKKKSIKLCPALTHIQGRPSGRSLFCNFQSNSDNQEFCSKIDYFFLFHHSSTSGCEFAAELHDTTAKTTFVITRSQQLFYLFFFFLFLPSSHEPFLPPDLGGGRGGAMMASDAELIKEQS